MIRIIVPLLLVAAVLGCNRRAPAPEPPADETPAAVAPAPREPAPPAPGSGFTGVWPGGNTQQSDGSPKNAKNTTPANPGPGAPVATTPQPGNPPTFWNNDIWRISVGLGSLASGLSPGAPAPGSGYAARFGAVKDRLLREGGATIDTERAVVLGLAWLAGQQKTDPKNDKIGYWEFDSGSHKPNYNTMTPERVTELRALATALTLLPFLGAGQMHQPGPDGKPTPYQEVVAKGLNYLKSVCPLTGPNAGKLSRNMYEQGITALPFVEAYGMTRDPPLKRYAQAVVNYIQKAQGQNGSWGYAANQDGDTSITGWQLQVLAAAKMGTVLAVDDAVVKNAMKFLDSVACGNKKGLYGYRTPLGDPRGDREKSRALIAASLLGRYYLDGWGPTHAGLNEGVEFFLTRNPPGKFTDLYYYYYANQVVHWTGGEAWKTWNEGARKPNGTRAGGFRDWVLKAQVRNNQNLAGSWDPEGGWFGQSSGRISTTAVCLLTLEVYYRYLPLDNRGTDPKDARGK